MAIAACRNAAARAVRLRRFVSVIAAAIVCEMAFAAACCSTRIVSLDGASTEIISALGAGNDLVGRDDSSYYPPSVSALPSIGYQFTLDAESILSLHPTLVIGRSDAKPQAALDQIRSAGVPLRLITNSPSIAGAEKRMREIAATLDRKAAGESLIDAMERSLSALRVRIAARQHTPRIRALVLLGVSAGTVFACGPQTGPGAAIALADADNALPTMHGCKKLTSEAIMAANPGAIVVLNAPGASSDRASVEQLPGVAFTNAGRAHRIVLLDALFVAGFGPREGRALLELFDDLYAR